MRIELFCNPLLLSERLGQWATERRRLNKLRGTVAHGLTTGHIDSLELLELLRDRPPRVIYDIGANVGTWTLLAKTIFPDAVVHAFEPLPAPGNEFLSRSVRLRDVTLHRIALGASNGNGEMHVPNRADAASLLPMTDKCHFEYSLSPEEIIPVKIERLDDVVRDRQLPKPDLIKLDIQGCELSALQGGCSVITSASSVLTEVSFVELYKGQCLFHELTTFLSEKGFLLFAVGSQTGVGRRLIQADVLYVRGQESEQQ